MIRVVFISHFYCGNSFDRGVILVIPGFVSVNILLELTAHENLLPLQMLLFF